jgi:dienelactone hydrolase
MRDACLRGPRLGIFAVLLLVFALPAHAAATSDPVEVPSGDLKLKGLLYKPEGTGPFPAVVAMHGCEGLFNPAGKPFSRYQDWADWLLKAGFAVLYVDSYGPRGQTSQCRTRTPPRTDRERVKDAGAARTWLQAQPYVKPEHVALLGWSTGAVGVLWSVRPRGRAREPHPDFRSAVAFYPGCRRLETTAWSSRIPTLVLIGGADDVVSVRSCEQMVAGARGRSARATIVVYPGAYHDFDHPNRTVQSRAGYAFSADGSGRVHTGRNPVARDDARRRALEWLER